MRELEQARKNLDDRLGVDHRELSSNPEAQRTARKNLDELTAALRDKYNISPELLKGE